MFSVVRDIGCALRYQSGFAKMPACKAAGKCAMLLLQQTMREYLEIRHAQLDVLFAQTDLIIRSIRLLDNCPFGMIKRLYRFQRQCRSIKRVLIHAERSNAINWERTRTKLDHSCDDIKNMFCELRSQLTSRQISEPGYIDIAIKGSPNLATTILDTQPEPGCDKLTNKSLAGENLYAAEHQKPE